MAYLWLGREHREEAPQHISLPENDDWERVRPYGYVTYSDGLSTIRVDVANDIVASGTDEDIRNLRRKIINDEVTPLLTNVSAEQLLIAQRVIAEAMWLNVGYSILRGL